MEGMNQENRRNLTLMRFWAQMAEKVGWTVGGISAAYLAAGITGLVTFSLTMLFSANIQIFKCSSASLAKMGM